MMQTVTVTWTWVFTTPLHCGAGLSRPGVADRLIQRDPRDRELRDSDRAAWLTGDAVKGALRMSAEQVAAWLGEPQDYDYSRGAPPAEPVSAPLAALFGRDAMSHFAMPTRIDNEAHRQRGVTVVASTAIDPRTGAARQDSLREVEVAFGSRFRNTVTLHLDGDEAHRQAAATLLLAAVGATETVGAKRGIGWGHVEVEPDSVEVTGADAVLDLDNLKKALGLKRAAWQSWLAGVPATESRQANEWFQFEIELTEPTCLTSDPEITNHLKTDRVIRASTLRGAFAGYWRKKNVKPEDILARLGAATRWSPGFPALGDACFVPAPMSFMGAKRGSQDSSIPLVIDALLDERVLDHDDHPLPTKPLGGLVSFDGGVRTLPLNVTETRMHVHRDWRTGSKRDGALFSRERLIPERLRFTSWALLPSVAFEVAEGASTTLYGVVLGKRPSAGSGAVTITVRRGALPQFGEVSCDEDGEKDTDVFVQLLSPAIVRMPGEFGALRQSLAPSDWITLAGVDASSVTLVSEGDAQRSVGGLTSNWMSTWGHPRAAATCVEAGSVWRLRCTDVDAARLLRDALRGRRQIGERQHEGFGWLAVDPEWIRRRRAPRITKLDATHPSPPETKEQPSSWPGVEGNRRAQALELLKALSELTISSDAQGPLHELARKASIASTAQECHAIKQFCADRARRDRPGQWKQLKDGEPLRRILDRVCGADADPGLLRFVLNVAITRAMSVRQR